MADIRDNSFWNEYNPQEVEKILQEKRDNSIPPARQQPLPKPSTPWAGNVTPTKPTTFFIQKPCSQCNKSVDISQEKYYTINMEQTKPGERIVKSHFFHEACFEEIAGKRYMF